MAVNKKPIIVEVTKSLFAKQSHNFHLSHTDVPIGIQIYLGDS